MTDKDAIEALDRLWRVIGCYYHPNSKGLLKASNDYSVIRQALEAKGGGVTGTEQAQLGANCTHQPLDNKQDTTMLGDSRSLLRLVHKFLFKSYGESFVVHDNGHEPTRQLLALVNAYLDNPFDINDSADLKQPIIKKRKKI